MNEPDTRLGGGDDGPAPPRARSRARWAIVAMSILAIDGAVILWIIAAQSLIAAEPGVGMHNSEYYSMYDGSSVVIADDAIAGTSTWTVTRPATAAGLCRVWWPTVPAGLLTLSGFALARTHRGRRYVAEFSPPRLTMGRLLIAVAVLGTEGGLALRTLESAGFQAILFPRWERELSPTQLDQLLLHGLLLLVVAVALLVRIVRRGLYRHPSDASGVHSFPPNPPRFGA